jgi:hypothetical protein
MLRCAPGSINGKRHHSSSTPRSDQHTRLRALCCPVTGAAAFFEKCAQVEVTLVQEGVPAPTLNFLKEPLE